MFILGHLGIGTAIVTTTDSKVLRDRRQFFAVAFGALLPDLVDKTLYYGMVFATGRKGIELGIWSGTRTIGHSLLFAGMIWGLSLVFRKSRPSVRRLLLLISVGVLTHLLLDQVSNYFNSYYSLPEQDPMTHPPVPNLADLLWPFLGWQFPVTPFSSGSDHAGSILRIHTVAAELVGGGLLLYQYNKRRL